MYKFSEEVLARIDSCVLCWLATSSAHNVPNVSPKEAFVALGDDTLLIANIASPKSAANVSENPSVCVALVDIFVQKGFQIFGTASLVRKEDSEFHSLAAPLEEMTNRRFPFNSLFKVVASGIKPIIAPSYVLYPETTEQQQIASSMKSYRLDTD
ncbi:pyridoxamine 5'-phosphate oxidase family protein [Planctomycetota bacterium]